MPQESLPHVHLGLVDTSLLVIYLVFVVGIGAFLKSKVKTSSDFFLSGRSIPAWITGLAFLSANLGAQEVIGMGASGAKYGIQTAHFYWIGAIPAMVFVGVFMMPFYYGSKARSVPEYLSLRFDGKTRGLNAFSFAIMTLFSSGISLFAMTKLLELLLGWNFYEAMVVSGGIVLVYIFLGGLTSAIYNEVLQFFLIVFGFAPLVILGLIKIGGWDGLKAKLDLYVTQQNAAVLQHNQAMLQGNGTELLKTAWAGNQADPMGAFTHSWQGLAHASTNLLGVDWFGLVFGLGFVLSFGYWCTDFLVVQRAMAAKSMSAARRTPLIAAIPKMLFPFLVILPGMLALGLTAGTQAGAVGGFQLPKLPDGTWDYNNAAPLMLIHFFPTGLLGLGMTALVASFMSGMAGNVTAFNTIFTVDIYESFIKPGQSDKHYLAVGKWATVLGILASVGAALLAAQFNNIMDLLQLVFAFVNAPLFATFLLGMFWKRTTGHGAFWGLLGGTVAAAVHNGLTQGIGDSTLVKGGWLSTAIYNAGYKNLIVVHPDKLNPNTVFAFLHQYPSDMAESFWTAIFAWTFCFSATIIISLLTKRTKTDEELTGLVYSLTPKAVETEKVWLYRPAVLGTIIIVLVIILNYIFR
jgi:SSS family solute:Na+ symporter